MTNTIEKNRCEKVYNKKDINKPYKTIGKKFTVVNNTPTLTAFYGYSVSVRTIYGFIEKIIIAKNAKQAIKEFIKQYPPFL